MMEMIIPEIYTRFYCKAGDCQHSCCKESWEIDVDADTADYYFQVTGELGKLLKENIGQNKEGYHIKENSAGKCPFLRKDGLCRLVAELGEDSLCDICALHPRFYEVMADKDLELGGVGLCCERTCELLLENKEPLQFCFDEAEDRLFTFEELLEKLGIILKKEELRFKTTIEKEYVQWVLSCLGKTEPLDDQWTTHIMDLQNRVDEVRAKLTSATSTAPWALFDKIYQYILYRQLEKSAKVSARVLVVYAHLNTEFVLLDSLITGDLPEALRRWSGQIEYDTDNVDMLLGISHDHGI